MYSSSNVTKVLVYAAVIGGVIYFVNKLNTDRREAVESVVAAIGETAAVITESGGQNPERIALVIAKLEDSSLGNIEKALADIEDGPAQYIAVELLLRRIFEMKNSAILRSGIKRQTYTPKSYPWTIEGETGRLEPFEITSDPPGKIKFLFETFSSQGYPRRPWR